MAEPDTCFWWSLFLIFRVELLLWQLGCDDRASIICVFLGFGPAVTHRHTHTHTRLYLHLCEDTHQHMPIPIPFPNSNFLNLNWTLKPRLNPQTDFWKPWGQVLTCDTFLTTSPLIISPWTNDLAVTKARITFAFMSRGTSPNGRSVSCCLATHSR